MKAEVYMGNIHVGSTESVTVVALALPFPKPARVEKWQRWRDSKGVEFTAIQSCGKSPCGLLEKWLLRKDGCDGQWYGVDMLEGRQWTFLGYAKPDKVEVGQRWRSKTCGYDVRRKMAHPMRDDVWELLGEDRVAMDSTETEIRGWEYLGMAESADAKKEAPRFEPVALAGLQSVVAAKTEYVTVDDLSAPPVQTKRTADQARQDARRANEEAAKRLIANPPEWAYPTAWMCAVLRQLERGNRAEFMEREFSPGFCFYEELRMYHANRLSGQTHDMAKSRMNMPELCGAYARGMERPSPLMGRPGVKSGVSTCDLGVEYE